MTNCLKHRISFFDMNLVKLPSREFKLVETNVGGEAEIDLLLGNADYIVFEKMEKHVLSYLKNKKSADYVIFQSKNSVWYLHIIEFKRTVSTKEWEAIKMQFSGSLQNALALAGFLEIKIDYSKVFIYTAYRNDRINNTADTVKLRFNNFSRNKINRIDINIGADWNNKQVNLDFEPSNSFLHKKIRLDIKGKAKYKIK